jgi:hypothetical protein
VGTVSLCAFKHLVELGCVAFIAVGIGTGLFKKWSMGEQESESEENSFYRLGAIILGFSYLVGYLFHMINQCEYEDDCLPPIMYYELEASECISDCLPDIASGRVHPITNADYMV